MKHAFLPAIALTVAVGCAPIIDDPLACDASDYASLVGSNVAAASFPAGMNVRIIRPGDVITMDYNPNRLNLVVDGNGTITRVYCG